MTFNATDCEIKRDVDIIYSKVFTDVMLCDIHFSAQEWYQM